jgi:hypothetical protein
MYSTLGEGNRGEAANSLLAKREARGVYAAMEMWIEGRRRVLTGEVSKRAACREYGINWRTLVKILGQSGAEPSGGQKSWRGAGSRMGTYAVALRAVSASEAVSSADGSIARTEYAQILVRI